MCARDVDVPVEDRRVGVGPEPRHHPRVGAPPREEDRRRSGRLDRPVPRRRAPRSVPRRRGSHSPARRMPRARGPWPPGPSRRCGCRRTSPTRGSGRPACSGWHRGVGESELGEHHLDTGDGTPVLVELGLEDLGRRGGDVDVDGDALRLGGRGLGGHVARWIRRRRRQARLDRWRRRDAHGREGVPLGDRAGEEPVDLGQERIQRSPARTRRWRWRRS